MRETITITRKELYEEVWNTPMVKLAEKYGLSDVGLAKICRKNNIPKPPRGYWARTEAGQRVRKKPLPTPQKDYPIEIHQNAPGMCGQSGDTGEQPTETQHIEVPESLSRPHPLIRLTAPQLRQAESDEQGLLKRPQEDCLDIHVSKKARGRALLLMDTLIKALEARGLPLSLAGDSTVVRVNDVNVRFGLSEQLDPKRVHPKDHGSGGYYHFGHSRFETTKVPSGRLTLTIHDHDPYWRSSSGSRQNWNDTEKKKLETQLAGFVRGLLKMAERMRSHAIEKEREEREKREALRRREEAKRIRTEKLALIQAEKDRVARLLLEAENWRKAQLLRDYVEARKEVAQPEEGHISPHAQLPEWVEWVTDQAHRLDPLRESPYSMLDEEEELVREGEAEKNDSRYGYRY